MERLSAHLMGARKQLPDRPSIIFVNVPSRWLEEPNIGQELNDMANNFLRGTGRIASIKYYVSRLMYRNGALTHDHFISGNFKPK